MTAFSKACVGQLFSSQVVLEHIGRWFNHRYRPLSSEQV
jgi:hypothetical protein